MDTHTQHADTLTSAPPHAPPETASLELTLSAVITSRASHKEIAAHVVDSERPALLYTMLVLYQPPMP